MEQSAHFQPGIKSITPAHIHSFFIDFFSKTFKTYENDVKLLISFLKNKFLNLISDSFK